MAWGYWSTYSHAQTSQVIASHLNSSRGSRVSILSPATPSGISKRERSLERSEEEDASREAEMEPSQAKSQRS